jgi:translation initiation factor 2B subunit (eIF-2B alpha/beta/delta family)
VQHDSRLDFYSLDELLAALENDNRSGAAELLGRAADVFARLRADHSDTADSSKAQQAAGETAVALIRAQPDIAPLVRLADAALTAAGRAGGAQDALRAAERSAHDFIARAARAAEQTATHAARLIDDGAVVLTHSRSSTVLAALKQARRDGRGFRVIVTESRPMLEGRALAEALAAEALHVTLIADAAAALMMAEADCLIVGADRVTPEHLVNKIGTRMLALAARERGVKVFALGDTSKFIAGWPAPQADHQAAEVWRDAPPQVEILNRYFEPTPLDDFAAVICEDGALTPREAGRRAAQYPISPALLAAYRGA